MFQVIAFKSCMSAFVIRDEVSFEFRLSSQRKDVEHGYWEHLQSAFYYFSNIFYNIV